MASQIATELEDTVRRVPMIGWVALAGGAALFVFARHNHTAANILNPNAATPNVDSGALPGQVFPSGTTDTGGSVSPGTTPDPGATPVVPPPDYHQKTTDVLGGTLGQFIAGLTNQPDFVNFTSGDTSVTESSGVATFGGGNGTQLAAPSWIDAMGNAIKQWGNGGLYDPTRGIYIDPGVAEHFGINAFNPTDASGQTSFVIPFDQNTETAAANAYINRPRFLGPPTSGGTPRFLGPPTAKVCADGDTACIRQSCHSGDTACAHSVAPWWRGDTISGW